MKWAERWTFRRKAAILDALDAGTTTADELATVHGITTDELAEWRRAVARAGDHGLKVTKRPRRRTFIRKRT